MKTILQLVSKKKNYSKIQNNNCKSFVFSSFIQNHLKSFQNRYFKDNVTNRFILYYDIREQKQKFY